MMIKNKKVKKVIALICLTAVLSLTLSGCCIIQVGGVKSAQINENGELILEYSFGREQNMGKVVGEDGKDGAPGVPGDPGKDGMATDFLPQAPLTRAALSDRSRPIYFQTEDAYEVAQTEEEHSLMLALYTPEGYVFPYTSGYIFMPEMNGSDLWVSDVSVIFEDYEQFVPEEERWPAGEYLFVYYIDGGVVATIPFTLE